MHDRGTDHREATGLLAWLHTHLHARLHTRATQRGEHGAAMALQVLIGAVIGTMVIGGFTTYWINANRASKDVVERTSQQSAAVTVLNRMSRDISESTRVLVANPHEVVVEKQTGSASSPQFTRVSYKVAVESSGTGGTASVFKLVRSWTTNTSGSWSPEDAWDNSSTMARNVLDQTRFDYAGADGNGVTEPGKVGRVDITFVASTRRGLVTLKSSVAVRNAAGATLGAQPPKAVNDSVTVPRDGSVRSVDLLSNDTCNGGTTPCPRGQLSEMQVTGFPASWTVTLSATTGVVSISIPASESLGTKTFAYTITDANGSASASVAVEVVDPPRPPVAANDTINTVVAVPATLDLGANDSYVRPGATLSLGSLPEGVEATTSGTQVTVQTGDTVTAPVTFAYTITNPDGYSSQANVTVRAIKANPDTVTVQKGAAGYVNVTDNDTTTPGASTTSVINVPSGITATIDANGLMSVNVSAGSGYADGQTFQVGYRLTLPAAGTSPARTSDGVVTVTVRTAGGMTGRAYVKAMPTGRSYGLAYTTNVVQWSGGTAPYTVYGRSTQYNNNNWVPIGTASSSYFETFWGGWYGNKVFYRVVDRNGLVLDNLMSQMPPSVSTVAAQGSDTNGDLIPDAQGTSRVTYADQVFAPFTLNADAVGRALLTERSIVKNGSGVSARVVAANPSDPNQVYKGPRDTTGRCAGVANCYTRTGIAPGSETIYDVAAFVPCDDDDPNAATRCVTVAGVNGGQPVYPSWNYTHVPTYGTDAPTAYQAPSVQAQIASAGNAAADACYQGGSLANSAWGGKNVSPAPAGGDANQTLGCADNTAKTSYTATADESAPSDGKFCSYDGAGLDTCSARVVALRQNTPVTVGQMLSGTPRRLGTQRDVAFQALGWGGTHYLGVAACNPGGCSVPANTAMQSYPGPYGFYAISEPDNTRGAFEHYWNCGGTSCTPDSPKVRYSMAAFGWTPSEGADAAYRWNMTAVGGPAYGDTLNRGDTVTGATATPAVYVQDATRYAVSVRADTTSGLWRRDSKVAFTAPPPPGMVEDSPFCNKNNNSQGWKYGFGIRTNLWTSYPDPNAYGATGTGSYGSGVNAMIFSGMVGWGQDPERIGAITGQFFLGGTNDPIYLGTGGWVPPGQWWLGPDGGVGTFYVVNHVLASNDSYIPYLQGGLGVGGGIPYSRQYATGALRAESFTTDAAAGYPDMIDRSTVTGGSTSGQANSTSSRFRAYSVNKTCQNSNARDAIAGSGWLANAAGFQVSRRAHAALPGWAGNQSPATRGWADVN